MLLNNIFFLVRADKILELESKSIEEWTGFCSEKRKRDLDLPLTSSEKQKPKKVTKQITQNLPPSMQPILIPELSACLPDIDWG